MSDQYGYVHAFWIETLFDNQRKKIIYSRFDGETWTNPNDIIIPTGVIEDISAAVDQQGVLHLFWSQGQSGPVFYSHSPVAIAQSAINWSSPVQLNIPGKILQFRIDSKGVFHLVYIDSGTESGVYYTRSEDQGSTWSEPRWLDPDIPVSHSPASLNFDIDSQDGLHVVWSYLALFDGLGNHEMVRYASSLDGGSTWSNPYTIDAYVDGIDHELGFAEPKMAVQGDFIHVVWAAGSTPYRHHRFSNDRGLTWSAPMQIFGDLHGQAYDGLAVDGAGRVHFIGQVRYPLGIYHAIWDQGQWTPPELVYMISQGDFIPSIADRIHAHYTVPAVRSGNQLVLTFTDGPADPNRRLFAMVSSMAGIPASDPLPLPDAVATPVAITSPSIATQPGDPGLNTTPPALSQEAPTAQGRSRPDLIIWITLITNLLLFGIVLAVRSLRK